jgi:hypothetical protein
MCTKRFANSRWPVLSVPSVGGWTAVQCVGPIAIIAPHPGFRQFRVSGPISTTFRVSQGRAGVASGMHRLGSGQNTTENDVRVLSAHSSHFIRRSDACVRSRRIGKPGTGGGTEAVCGPKSNLA